MAPAVKRLLPPASSSGARSSTSTDTPCSRAASAAHNAALPPPTITTSAEAGSMSSAPVLVETEDYTRGARNFQEGHQPRRLVRSAAEVDALRLAEARLARPADSQGRTHVCTPHAL